MSRIVVCVSGASGVILAHKTVAELLSHGHRVDLVISRDAPLTITEELGPELASGKKFCESFGQDAAVTLYNSQDFSAPIASGSCLFDAVLIVPCSMATLGAVAAGLSDNLIRRVADVCLKERRKLVLAVRETPLSAIHLENMLKLSQLGAVILPPVPAWYLKPQSVGDIEDTIVTRILDQIGIHSNKSPRWEGT